MNLPDLLKDDKVQKSTRSPTNPQPRIYPSTSKHPPAASPNRTAFTLRASDLDVPSSGTSSEYRWSTNPSHSRS